MSITTQGSVNRWSLSFAFAPMITVSILISCAGHEAERTADPRQHRASSPRPTESARIVFNIPSLIGKSIDEVRQSLGKPQDEEIEPTELQLRYGADEWSNVFTKDGQDLLVTFDPRTRRVIDLFLAGNNRTALMQQGNLAEGTTAYRVESVRGIRDPTEITGIKVVPTR